MDKLSYSGIFIGQKTIIFGINFRKISEHSQFWYIRIYGNYGVKIGMKCLQKKIVS